jgi:hypothetical protein
VNRASIEQHGLDWNRMGKVGGIAAGAGSPSGWIHRPEADAVFLCGSLEEAEWFAQVGEHPLVDMWQVDVRGLELEDAPDGWLWIRQPVERSCVSLLRSDIEAPPTPFG